MLNIDPKDFDKDSGRRKIVASLHQMEVRIMELEQKLEDLKKQERKDIKDIFKSE